MEREKQISYNMINIKDLSKTPGELANISNQDTRISK
jgi:hypothetical protein